MRLLVIQESGGFGHMEVDPDDSDMPPYAVLSHTWGPMETNLFSKI